MKKIINILLSFSLIFQVNSYANTQTPAKDITVTTGAFVNCLTSGDTNVQLSLNQIDACLASSGSVTFIDSLIKIAGNVSLVNDSSSPGNSYYYGTNGSGIKGYFPVQSGVTGVNWNQIGGNQALVGVSGFNWLSAPMVTQSYNINWNDVNGNVTINSGGINWASLTRVINTGAMNWPSINSLAKENANAINWADSSFGINGMGWLLSSIAGGGVNWSNDIQIDGSNVGIGTNWTVPPATLFSVGVSSSNASTTHNAFNINTAGTIINIGGQTANIGAVTVDLTNSNASVSFGNNSSTAVNDFPWVNIHTNSLNGYVAISPGADIPSDFFAPGGDLGIGTGTNWQNIRGSIDTGTSGTIYGSSYNSSAATGSWKSTNGMTIDPTGAGPLMYLSSGRNVGIGNSNPQYALDTPGTIEAGNLNITNLNGINWTQIQNISGSNINWTSIQGLINSIAMNWTDINLYGKIGNTAINWNTFTTSGIMQFNGSSAPSAVSIGTGLSYTGGTLSVSGGGSQTPWASNINGGGYQLTNAGINWPGITSSGNVNWNAVTLFNMGINWGSMKDIGLQSTNWYDITVISPTFVAPVLGAATATTVSTNGANVQMSVGGYVAGGTGSGSNFATTGSSLTSGNAFTSTGYSSLSTGSLLNLSTSSNSYTGTGLAKIAYTGTDSGNLVNLSIANVSASGHVLTMSNTGTGATLIVNSSGTSYSGDDACIGAGNCLGACTAGTFPSCSTCTCL